MNKRQRTILLCLLCACLPVLSIAHSAAGIPNVFFPRIANGQPVARLIKLVDHDAGFVDAVATPDCRFFVNWQSRPDGHVHVTEQVTDTLRELPPPDLGEGVRLPVPAYTLPGPKQGSSRMVVCGLEKRTYFTGRAEGDDTGPFFVWVLIEPIPGVMR